MRTHWRGSGIEPGCTGLVLAVARLSVAATDASARNSLISVLSGEMWGANSLMDMRAMLLRGGFDAARTSSRVSAPQTPRVDMTRD